MITKEERNIFIALHDRLEELGAKTSFQYGSHGVEFHSTVAINGASIQSCLYDVTTEEDHKKIDDYRKLLVGIIENHKEVA